MLNIDVRGDGAELVMLHGWGMHSGIMMPWARDLAASFRVSLVDLPGHGNSRDAELAELDDWADAVLEAVPANAWWLGWSLGGLVALAASQRNAARVRGIALVSSTPKFVAGEGWQSAVQGQVFDQFAHQLQENVDRTLLRFLSLQVRGSDRAAESLRELRTALDARPRAELRALRSGLRFLKDADMRTVLRTTDLPVFSLLGERDTLVPAGVSGAFAADRVSVVPGAGHAPFLSHPRECAEQVKRWLLTQQEQGKYAAH